MPKLIYYELKKVFSSSFLKILLLFLLALNVFFSVSFVNENSYAPKRLLLDKAYLQYREDPASFRNDYDNLMRYYAESATPANPFPKDPYLFGGEAADVPDWVLYEEVLEAVDSERTYKDTITTVIDQAGAIRQDLSDKLSYQYRYQSNIIETYSALTEKVEFKGSLITSWNILFSYEGDYFPVFLIVISCAAYIALCDKQNGFYSISGNSRKGRNHSVFAKLCALLILASALVILFSATSFIAIGIANGGYSTATEAMQVIHNDYVDMTYFPFAMNLWQGFLFTVLYKCISVIFLSMAVFLTAVLTKSIWFTLLLGSGFSILQYYIPSITANFFSQWKYLCLHSLFTGKTISSYRSVNIGGEPVNLSFVVYFVFAFLFVITLLLAFRAYPLSHTRTKYFFHLNSFSKNDRQRKLSLLSFELYKNRIFFLCIIFLLVIKIWLSATYFQIVPTTYDRYYKEYIDGNIGGEYTEEKARQIEYETLWYQSITEQYGEMHEKFLSQQISDEEFIHYLREYSSAETKIKVLNDLKIQADYLKELYEKEGIIGSFLYDTDYNFLMAQGPDLILIGFICLFAMHQYLTEFNESGPKANIYPLLQSTAKGRIPLFGRKLSLCLVTAPPLWIAFKAIDLHFFLKSFEFPDLSAPLISMPAYENTLSSISISDYLFISSLFSLLGTVLLTEIVFILAFFIKKRFLAYPITISTVLIPHFVGKAGVAFGKQIDLTMLYNTNQMYQQYQWIGSCLFFAAILSFVTVGILLAKKKVKEGII